MDAFCILVVKIISAAVLVPVRIVPRCFLCYNRTSKTTGKYLREYQRQGKVIK